jgi:hypothetical protein
MTQTQTKLTANQVCEACGNNETKILGLAAGYFGIPHGQSWYIAASEIAKELNRTAADPLSTCSIFSRKSANHP